MFCSLSCFSVGSAHPCTAPAIPVSYTRVELSPGASDSSQPHREQEWGLLTQETTLWVPLHGNHLFKPCCQPNPTSISAYPLPASVPSCQASSSGTKMLPNWAPHTRLESFSEYPSTPLFCPLSSLPSPEPNQTSQEMLEGIFCLSVLGFPGARETSYISSDLNHQRRATASSHPSATPISLE